MEENAQNPVMKAALIYGAIIGFVSIVLSVVLDLLGWTFETWAGLLGLVITVVLIAYCQTAYKKEYLGGYAKYEQLILLTLLIAIVSSVLTTVYNAINITLIDPDALEKMYNMAYNKIANNPRVTDEMLDVLIDRMEGRFTVGRVLMQGFVGSLIVTMIIGVITGAFIKKIEPGLDNVA